jgi:hypothetical protein
MQPWRSYLTKYCSLLLAVMVSLSLSTCWHYRIHSIDCRSNIYLAFPSYISKICKSSQYFVGYAEANATTRQFDWGSDVCELRTDEVSQFYDLQSYRPNMPVDLKDMQPTGNLDPGVSTRLRRSGGPWRLTRAGQVDLREDIPPTLCFRFFSLSSHNFPIS